MRRRACLLGTLALLLGRPALAADAAAPRPGPPASKGGPYAESIETIEIVADEAPVTLAGTTIGAVKKGQWFGVRERRGDLFGIQFFGGRNLRQGWVRAADARLLADGDVDLTTEALKLAKQFDPKVDVGPYKARVDALAARVAAAAARAATPQQKAIQISIQLFRHERFGYELKPRPLNAVLDSKRGNCLGLSLLYLCAAEKLGMPFRMLPFPQHALIHYDDGKEQFNVEPSWGGYVLADDAYMRRRYGPPEGISWMPLSRPQTMTMLYSDMGAILGDQDRLDEAAVCFSRAIEINPYYGVPYYNWGNALGLKKKFALACDKYARTTQLHPRFAEAYSNWGTVLLQMGEMAWACDKFAAAAKLDPDAATIYFNWATALLALGKRDEAAEKFEKAVELQPGLRPLVDKTLRSMP